MGVKYVVYTEYEHSFKAINNISKNVEINKIFTNSQDAITYVKNEVCFQCDYGIWQDGTIYQQDYKKENDEWNFKAYEYNKGFYVEIYIDKDWQYTIYCEEKEVE